MSTIEHSERTQAFREWESHYRRWAVHELHTVTDTGALLSWLPESVLDTMLPTNRTLRMHLKLQQTEAQRVLDEMEERLNLSRGLSVDELWRKVDPLGKIEEGVTP